MKQKRQNSGLVQANDLRVGSAKRPISGSRSRELHGKYSISHIYCCYVPNFINVFSSEA